MNQGYDLRIVCSFVDQVGEGEASAESFEPIDLSSHHDIIHEVLIIQVVGEQLREVAILVHQLDDPLVLLGRDTATTRREEGEDVLDVDVVFVEVIEDTDGYIFGRTRQ
jgi:hypothetical protein